MTPTDTPHHSQSAAACAPCMVHPSTREIIVSTEDHSLLPGILQGGNYEPQNSVNMQRPIDLEFIHGSSVPGIVLFHKRVLPP